MLHGINVYMAKRINISSEKFLCVDGRPIKINFYADKYLSGEIFLV